MHDKTKRQKIFIVGPAAAGKTSARRIIKQILAHRDIAVADLSIEDAHRSLCPPPGRLGYYHYDRHGALILEKRDQQIPAALRFLAQACFRASTTTGFIAEFTHSEPTNALQDYFGDTLPNATILQISARLSDRLQRNRMRKRLKIPEEVVTSEVENIDEEGQATLASYGASVYNIKNISSKGAFSRNIATVAFDLLDPNLPGDQLRTWLG